jgi:squalene-hopene/tetraprenyl-beta-curcumene cyclase
MNLQVDVERLLLAHKAVRAELLAERMPAGHWVGQTASSPLATAAAVSALVTAHRHDTQHALRDSAGVNGHVVEQLVQSDLSEFMVESLHWLAQHQNADGGWGDCEAAQSNIAATMLVQAAFRLTGIPAKYADLMLRADDYAEAQGGVAGLKRRFGGDKALPAAILTNCALAGMVPWRHVPTLPFELACLPKSWQSFVQPPVARHELPLVLAIGRAKYHHRPPQNPIARLLRHSVCAKSLAILEEWQSFDDSFLASVPTTAFIVMSLASIGCQEHAIVQRGVEFLLSSVRGDSSWPAETNLATTVTSLALENLVAHQATSRPIRRSAPKLTADRWPKPHSASWDTATNGDTVTYDLSNGSASGASLLAHEGLDKGIHWYESAQDWLLTSQRGASHPLTNVPPGGWAWNDAPGALPNTSDTAAALIALARWASREEAASNRIEHSARLGIRWLLDLQNDDGGWPIFCRDGSSSPLDESGSDVTAHALRALVAWRPFDHDADAVIERGWQCLESIQRDDGSFIPQRFGNENQPDEYNPVYGTAQVLIACAELNRLESEVALRAMRWLLSAQHAGGGWGPPRAPVNYSGAEKDGFRAWRANEAISKLCSVEETGLAVTALLPLADSSDPCAKAVAEGLNWLVNAVEQDAHRRPAVVGFSLSKLWYHERLYPLVFAAGALSRAEQRLASQQPIVVHVG